MVDEYQGASELQEVPGQEQLKPQAGAEGEQPKPITKADLEAFSTSLRKDLLNVIRSQTIQTESKIKKEVDAKLNQVETNFKQLKEAGYAVSEDDLKIARSQAISEALKTLQSGGEDAQSEPAPALDPKQQAVIKETNEALRQLQKEMGYVITGNDPEFYEIDWNDPEPNHFLQTYREKQVEILGRRGLPIPQQQSRANPATRIPTPIGSGDLGSREEQLNKRLQQIQGTDPFSRDAALTKERADIKKEMEALYINRR